MVWPGDRARLEHNAAAAVVNLIRLDAWPAGWPLDRTGPSTCSGST